MPVDPNHNDNATATPPRSRARLSVAAIAGGVAALVGGLAISLFLLTSPLAAGTYFAPDGVAIGGYDPVAYFTARKPVAGTSQYAHKWRDTTWHFANDENRAAFVANPQRYAPRYGGYCAYAAAKNYVYRTDPNAWSIVDGKLYLNASLGVRKTWSGDIPGNIAAADKNWPELEKGL